MPNASESDRFPVRKNPRLKNFDYSSHNYYFVTICTRNKQCILGSPARLSHFGEIARDCIQELSQHFSQVMIDKWVIMTNHVHLIVILPGRGAVLSNVIGQYKSAVSRRIHTIQPDFPVWQTSFHDHVIRDQADYERIWSYIDTNPARWMDDCFYAPQPD